MTKSLSVKRKGVKKVKVKQEAKPSVTRVGLLRRYRLLVPSILIIVGVVMFYWMQFGGGMYTMFEAERPSVNIIGDGIEAEEAAFLKKSISKDKPNNLGPAPVVKVTVRQAVKDKNGKETGEIIESTAPVTLTQISDPNSSSVAVIASEIKKEVLSNPTAVIRSTDVTPPTPPKPSPQLLCEEEYQGEWCNGVCSKLSRSQINSKFKSCEPIPCCERALDMRGVCGGNYYTTRYVGTVASATSCPRRSGNCSYLYDPYGQPKSNLPIGTTMSKDGNAICEPVKRGTGGGGLPPTIGATEQKACENANPGLVVQPASVCQQNCDAAYVKLNFGLMCRHFGKVKLGVGQVCVTRQIQCYSSPADVQEKAVDICKSIPLNTTMISLPQLGHEGVNPTSVSINGGQISLTTGTLETSGEPNALSGVSCKNVQSTDCLNKIGKGIKDLKGNDITFVHESCPYVGNNGQSYEYSTGTCCPNN